VHLYSTFAVDPRIFPYGQIYTKNTICAIVRAVSPHFNTAATTVKFGLMVQTGDSPQAKFCIKKSIKGVYPFWANLYQTLQISAIFAAVSLHFKSENGEIWRECTDPGHPLPPYFCKKKSLRGICPLGGISTKNSIFSRILAT